MAQIEFSKSACYFREGDIVEYNLVSDKPPKQHQALVLGSKLDSAPHPVVSGGFNQWQNKHFDRWTVYLFDLNNQTKFSIQYQDLDYPWNVHHAAEVYRVTAWVEPEK